MPDRVISVPQATQIATRIKNKFDNVNGRLREQQEVQDNSSFVYRSSILERITGTSTAGNKRLLLNVGNPIPASLHLGTLQMLCTQNVLTGTAKIELATLNNGTYTVYDSVTAEVTTKANEQINVLNIDKVTQGETYVFITLSKAYMYHVASVEGKKMEICDTIEGETFTTRKVNNYEIVFRVFCSVSEDFVNGLNEKLAQIKPAIASNIVSYISGNGYRLITTEQMIDGYYCVYNTGAVTANSGYSVTPLVPVKPNLSVNVTGGANGSQVAYYDANGDYVTGVITRTASSITVPDNDSIAYMRWCTAIENKGAVLIRIYEQEREDTLYIDTSKGILDGVIEAYDKGLKKIVVYAGEYDVLAEYQTHFGSDCWDNYGEAYNVTNMGIYGRGIWLDNVDITFMPGAKVVAHYTGSNDNVKKFFSPFAVGSDAVIKGLVVDASNLRYCVHPDFHPRTYENLVFKDCDFHHLKGTDWNEAVGCGFGEHSYWTFENCIFRSDGNYRVFRIHNSSVSGAQSKAIVKNCYVVGNGYMAFNAYGESTLVSSVEVCGCSWITPARAGTEPGAPNDNMSMLAWCNETRSA